MRCDAMGAEAFDPSGEGSAVDDIIAEIRAQQQAQQSSVYQQQYGRPVSSAEIDFPFGR